MNKSTVAIIGAGPAGCVAAMTLRRLGHDPVIYERETLPRHRVGESLLPGTLSILDRLGLREAIDAAGYVKKPSATFLWGRGQAPWTFSFSTPKTAPWVFDHSIQVDREHFDKLLLDTARAQGIAVHEGTAVHSIDPSATDRVSLTVNTGSATDIVTADFLIDAAGVHSPLARQLKIRRYDEFYKSFAVWSYFACPDPFLGDLRGTTYTISFEHGWVWMIPLAGEIYSVGLVVDSSKTDQLRSFGLEEFYRRTLATATRATALLGNAERIGQVRIIHDWSYDAEHFSADRYFLAGDSACFTDPMFSQGVHLATKSAVLAAAAIDRIAAHPDEHDAVHHWYNRTYRDTYEQYHEFLTSFYTVASFTEPDSDFWRKRRVSESDDERLRRKKWFEELVAAGREGSAGSMAEFGDRAAAMIAIGRHQREELSDEFRDDELNPARLRWVGELTKQLNRITRLQWNGSEVRLRPHYRTDPISFRLLSEHVLANEDDRDMVTWPMSEQHREIFARLCKEDVGYKEVIRALGEAGLRDLGSQIVIRLMEAGLLTGYDRNGERVLIQDRLHFDGVGAHYGV